MLAAPCFKRDIDRRIAQYHSIVSAIELQLDDVGLLPRNHRGKLNERARPVRQIDADAHQASVFHQAALDNSAQQRNVDVASANQHGGVLPVEAGFVL